MANVRSHEAQWQKVSSKLLAEFRIDDSSVRIGQPDRENEQTASCHPEGADGTVEGPVRQTIAARIEGNPFFIEEIVQSLFEEGVLIGNGQVKLVTMDKAGMRSMLTEIYNWFTEGFDTADLKEGKALLDELAVRGARALTL